jgi:hypothetical protein
MSTFLNLLVDNDEGKDSLCQEETGLRIRGLRIKGLKD